MVGLPNWAPVLGAGVADAVSGYQRALLELPKLRDQQEGYEQRRALRPLEREVAELDVEQKRQELTAPKALGYGGGYRLWNPQTRQWDVHEAVQKQRQPTRLDQMIHHIEVGQQSGATAEQQAISKALLTDLQAKGMNLESLRDSRDRLAKTREDEQDRKDRLEPYQVQLLQSQATAQRSRIDALQDTIRHHRSQEELYRAQAEHLKSTDAVQAGSLIIRAEHERRTAEDVKQQLSQAQQRLDAYERNIDSQIGFREDTTRQRDEVADQKRDDATAKREMQYGKLALLEEQVKQLKLKGTTLEPKLQAELKFLQEKAEQAKMKGETLPAFLEARLEKLVEDIAGAQGKRRLAEATEPAKIGKALADASTAREKLAQLEAKGETLPEKLQAELTFLKERAEQATTKGETWSDYLQGRLDKLQQDIDASQGRERRAEDLQPAKKSSGEVQLERQRESLATMKREAEADPSNTRLRLSIQRLEQVLKRGESQEQRAVAAAARANQRAKDARQPQTKIQTTPGGTTMTYELKTSADFATFEQAKRELTPLLKQLPKAAEIIQSKSPNDEAIYRMAWQTLGGATLPAGTKRVPPTSTPTTPATNPIPTGTAASGVTQEQKTAVEAMMNHPQSDVDAAYLEHSKNWGEVQLNAFRDAYQRKFGTDPPVRMP